jgi:hypothetical protein
MMFMSRPGSRFIQANRKKVGRGPENFSGLGGWERIKMGLLLAENSYFCGMQLVGMKPEPFFAIKTVDFSSS